MDRPEVPIGRNAVMVSPRTGWRDVLRPLKHRPRGLASIPARTGGKNFRGSRAAASRPGEARGLPEPSRLAMTALGAGTELTRMKSRGRTQPVAMTGGMAIVEQLIANGIDTVYGLPGAQLYPFFDALQLKSDKIRTFGARHEQACGYMAFGHARSTGKPGVYAVVPGPGVLNTTAALCTAFGTCTPVLCVTGQVPSAFLGRGRGHLHELSDQLGALRPFTKWGRTYRASGRCAGPGQRSFSPDALRPARPGRTRDGMGRHAHLRFGCAAACCRHPSSARAGDPTT